MIDKYITQDRIVKWIQVEEIVKKIISQKFEVPEDKVNLQEAVMIVLNLNCETDILDFNWDAEYLLEVISNIDFKAWTDYEEIDFTKTIIPKGIPKRLNEETIRTSR